MLLEMNLTFLTQKIWNLIYYLVSSMPDNWNFEKIK